MPIIFLDKSGFTGQDLLNSEQPVFTVATLNHSETKGDRCNGLKSAFVVVQNKISASLVTQKNTKTSGFYWIYRNRTDSTHRIDYCRIQIRLDWLQWIL